MEVQGFTASLLRASTRGFAGLAAARMFEKEPGLVDASGFDAWQDHLNHRILALASALEDDAPERFCAGVAWSRDAFVARAVPSESLVLALQCLEAVLEEALPSRAWIPLPEYFRRARETIRSSSVLEQTKLEEAGVLRELAQHYLDALVAGDEHRASALVCEALDAGRLSVKALIESVMTPVQRELGRRWHLGEVSVSEEHFATQATRRMLALALLRAPRAHPRKLTVVFAAVTGDAHDLGLAFVSAFFELDGWRTLFLGANTPAADLVSFAVRHQPELIALGATLDEHRAETAETIRALRATLPSLRFIVGGAAYSGPAELWRRSGADGYAADAGGAVTKGLELIGS